MNDISTNNDLPATFLRRTAALIYDFFLMFGIAIIYGNLFTLGRMLMGEDRLSPTSATVNVINLFVIWGLCGLFYCWCWMKKGQTLGMKSWRIKLVSGSDQALTWQQCWKRCFLATLFNTACGLGLIWSLLNRDKAALYDNLSNTQVILLPKAK